MEMMKEEQNLYYSLLGILVSSVGSIKTSIKHSIIDKTLLNFC